MDNQETEGAEVPTGLTTPDGDETDRAIDALLGIAAVPASGDSDGEPAKPGTAPAATLNAIATQAGLDPEALYKATIALPDEQGTATLEDLKNQATKYRKSEAQRTALADERTEFANQKLQALAELQTLVASIPQEHVSEDLRMQATAYQQQYNGQQDGLLLQVIPEWADPAVKAKDREDMASLLLTSYGVPANLLDLPLPAGLKKLVFDYTKLRQRIEGIKSKQSARAAKATKGTKPQATAQQDRLNGINASVKAGTTSKIDAIAQLLQG